MFRLTSAALAACLSLSLLPMPAVAVDFSASADLGAQFDSNARRSTTDEDWDIFYTPGLTARARHAGPNVDLFAEYHGERRIFQQDFFQDETRVTGYGNMVWRALPERLDVRVSQGRNESTRQRFGRGIQGDRQIVSTTEVAPTLRFRVRGADELQFTYVGTDTDSDAEDIDNRRHALSAIYQYSLSNNTEILLTATQGEIKYQVDEVPDIDFETYTLTLDTARDQNRLVLVGGYSVFERFGEEDVTGPIGNLNWSIENGYSTRFNITAAREITDRSQELLDVDSRQYDDIGFDNTDLTDIFRATRVSVSATQPFGATEGTVGLTWAKSDYERVPRDEDRWSIDVRATRLVRRSIEAEVSVRYDDVEYTQLLDPSFQQLRLSAFVNWFVNPKFEVEVGLFHLKRNGETGSGDFDNLGGFFNVRYYMVGNNTEDRENTLRSANLPR